jgi:hypothetical protein
MEPFNLRWPASLRWLLIIPVCLGVYVLTHLLINVLFVVVGGDLLTGDHPGYLYGWHGEGVVFLLHDALFAYASLLGIYYGAKIAPKYCFVVFLTLGCILSASILTVLLLLSVLADTAALSGSLRADMLELLLFPVGFALMAVHLRNEQR